MTKEEVDHKIQVYYFELLKSGNVEACNELRKRYPEFTPHLQSRRLVAMQLSGINLRNATIYDTSMSLTNLTESDLTETRFNNSPLCGAKLIEAKLTNSILAHGDLRHVDLTKADLSNVDLSSADLSHAKLNSSNLSNAFLAGANLTSADLTSARLKNADLHHVVLNETKGIHYFSFYGGKTCIIFLETALHVGDKSMLIGAIKESFFKENGYTDEGAKLCRKTLENFISSKGLVNSW